ncbi:MAG: JAB domain-containing protein [Kiritimatiellae bacterium]|nr:JAB domain-containing protein [Kiritimatiellia bacterium]
MNFYIMENNTSVSTPSLAVSILHASMPADVSEECFFVLPLDANGKMLAEPVMFSLGHKNGTTAVDPKEVFKTAFKVGADAIIVAHNHPSGNLTPNRADLRLTKELKSRAEWLGLEFIDHIILGSSDSAKGSDFVSLAESFI